MKNLEITKLIYSIRHPSICRLTSALETVWSNIRPHIGQFIALAGFWGFLAADWENNAAILDCRGFFAAGGAALLLTRFVAEVLFAAVLQLFPTVRCKTLSCRKLAVGSFSDDWKITSSSSSSLSEIPSPGIMSSLRSGSDLEQLAFTAGSGFGLKKCLMVGGGVVTFCKYRPMTADTASTRVPGPDPEFDVTPLTVDTASTRVSGPHLEFDVDIGSTSVFGPDPEFDVDAGSTRVTGPDPEFNVDAGSIKLPGPDPEFNVDTGSTQMSGPDPEFDVTRSDVDCGRVSGKASTSITDDGGICRPVAPAVAAAA